MSAMKIIDDTWYNRAFILLIQSEWSCRQPMGSLYCCFVTLHIDMNYYSACVLFVDACIAIQTNSAETSLALLAI